MKKHPLTIAFSALCTILVPAIGYISFGPWPSLLFLIGYLSGFALWLTLPSRAPFASIKFLYWATFVMFILHRVEEKVSGFFEKLSEITRVPTPLVSSTPIIVLLLISVGAWLTGPFLYSRGYEFGKYLVWTFFASMGVTELAHFAFPFFTPEPYGYFPGMLTVIVLAPMAWYCMWRLTRNSRKERDNLPLKAM